MACKLKKKEAVRLPDSTRSSKPRGGDHHDVDDGESAKCRAKLPMLLHVLTIHAQEFLTSYIKQAGGEALILIENGFNGGFWEWWAVLAVS